MKFEAPSLKIGDFKKHKWAMTALLIVIITLIIVHFIFIAPIMARKDSFESKIKQQKELIAKYEQKLNQSESIKSEFAKHEEDLREMQKKLFRGADPYQLAASLGDLLSSKGGGKGQKLDIKTYQVLASQEHGLYQEVHLRFNLMTNIQGLHYFLTRVKNSEFAILVQEINIQKIQRNRGPDLVVNVILAALMEKGASQ